MSCFAKHKIYKINISICVLLWCCNLKRHNFWNNNYMEVVWSWNDKPQKWLKEIRLYFKQSQNKDLQFKYRRNYIYFKYMLKTCHWNNRYVTQEFFQRNTHFSSIKKLPLALFWIDFQNNKKIYENSDEILKHKSDLHILGEQQLITLCLLVP